MTKHKKRTNKIKSTGKSHGPAGKLNSNLNQKQVFPSSSSSLKQSLAIAGFRIFDVQGDGNCLFRALAHQLGPPHTHATLRESIVRFIRDNSSNFSPFISDADTSSKSNDLFESYLRNMSQDGTYGGNVEIVACARMLNVDIAIWQEGEKVWVVQGIEEIDTIENGGNEWRGKDKSMPRRILNLVYYSWEHYSSVEPISDDEKVKMLSSPVVNPKLTSGSEWSEQEMFILKSTGSDESFVGVIRDLLLEYNQNVDKVVEVIWERRVDDPGYCCIAGNDSGLTAGDNGKPKGQPEGNQSEGEDKGGSGLSKDTPKAVVESCSQNGDNSNDDGETAKPKTPPNKTGKRVTARERKEIARRKQKESKKLKRQGQHGAKETAHRGGINGITDDIDGSGSVVNQMDRLFI